MKQDFEEFLMDKCDTHTNNDPAGFENWLEQLDVAELMLYGQEYGEKMFEKGKNFETNEMLNDLEKKDIIAGVDFKPALDSLKNITGSKLSDMLGKKEDTGSPYNEENRSWLKHKEFCNGCALCEL